MFGLFGQSKYIKEVYSKIRFFLVKAEIERTNDTFEKIKREVELNQGEYWDNTLSFHDLVAEQIDQVAWENREYLYENAQYSTNQAAIYSISEFIYNLSARGMLEEMRHAEQDMYEALKKMWCFCQTLASDEGTRSNYKHVVVSLKPFDQLINRL